MDSHKGLPMSNYSRTSKILLRNETSTVVIVGMEPDTVGVGEGKRLGPSALKHLLNSHFCLGTLALKFPWAQVQT